MHIISGLDVPLKEVEKDMWSWGTKEVEKNIYRIARIRERKTKHLCTVRCVKDEDQKVLVRDEKLKKDGESILTNCSMMFCSRLGWPYHSVSEYEP